MAKAERACKAPTERQIAARLVSMGAVEFVMEVDPDPEPYVGNCSAIDPATDAEQERWIADQIASGNEWAWCRVTVWARFENLQGSDSLCGCSYESRAAFQAGGYYEDMKQEAVRDVARQLGESVGALRLLGFWA